MMIEMVPVAPVAPVEKVCSELLEKIKERRSEGQLRVPTIQFCGPTLTQTHLLFFFIIVIEYD